MIAATLMKTLLFCFCMRKQRFRKAKEFIKTGVVESSSVYSGTFGLFSSKVKIKIASNVCFSKKKCETSLSLL